MIDELILKSLTDDLSAEERDRLNKWMDEDPANRKMMKAIEMYWGNGQQDLDQERLMVLERIKAKVKDSERAEGRSAFPVLKYLKYAAILVCVSTVSIFIYSSIKPDQEITVVRHTETNSLRGQKIDLVLPDGSKVKLNAGSKLTVPEQFRGHTREVELTGEGFFEVAHDAAHPFIVKMKDVEVQVLGTSFIARAYPDESDQTIAVKTGRVGVRRVSSGEEILLVPDEMAIVSQREMRRQNVGDKSDVFGWINGQVVFRDEPIGQVLKEIERWYGVNIKVQRKLDSHKLYTAHHDNPDIEEVLRSLSFVYGFKFKKINNEVIIK